MPIIAAGGVWNADSALEKIDAGASLVQFTHHLYMKDHHFLKDFYLK